MEYRYEQSEFIEGELEQMTEQIKSIIETLSDIHVNTFEFNVLSLTSIFFLQMQMIDTYLTISIREENLRQLMDDTFRGSCPDFKQSTKFFNVDWWEG